VATGASRRLRQRPRADHHPQPVEVHVAVPVHCEPPAELMAPLTVDLPEFVPASPPATSGLTPDGERKLMTLIWTLTQRLEAWKAHAAECRG